MTTAGTTAATTIEIKEHGVLFKGAMVRAILRGDKTQTRRVVKHALPWAERFEPAPFKGYGREREWIQMTKDETRQAGAGKCRYGIPGDRLWVKETFSQPGGTYHFQADEDVDHRKVFVWRPSVLMPRYASRITLDVVAVRVERLQDISETDAIAEGIESAPGTYSGQRFWKNYGMGNFLGYLTARDSYRTLWEKIHGPGSWAANPFVWVITFKKI